MASTYLTIDQGNTFAKLGVFRGGELVSTHWQLTATELQKQVAQLQPDAIMIASVSNSEEQLMLDFEVFSSNVFLLNPQTSVPLTKRYDTPHTLGADRVAAAVGATVLFPNRPCVVIDMGTCITYDFVDAERNFHGGLIAPGLKMRLKAMQHFTRRLPLVDVPGEWPAFVGKNTVAAMQSGVMNGLRGEIEGIIEEYEKIYGDFQTLICGGDARFFESQLKKTIFATPTLVLWGLHRILEHILAEQ